MLWLNLLVQGILLGGLYALFAAGLSLMFGVMKIINIAHGDFIVATTYMALYASHAFGISPFVSLIIVIPVSALLGYAVQRGLLNRVLRQELPPLVLTFGLSIVLENALQLGFSADGIRLHPGSIELSSFKLWGSLFIGVLPLAQFLTALALIAGLQVVFYKTSIGRAYRATADDPEVAKLMGLDTGHIIGLATGLAFAVNAIAGVFIGVRTTVTPLSGPLLLIFGFEAIIMGGLGSLWGTLAGGVVLGVAQSVGGGLNVAWSVLAGHLVFLLVLLFRPQGFFATGAH